MLPTSWAARLKLLLPSSRRRILYSISVPLSLTVPCTLFPAPYDARFLADCQPPPLPRVKAVLKIQRGRVPSHDLGPHRLRQMPQLALDELLRVGPHPVGMGKVRAPHHPVDPQLIEELHPDGVRLVRRPALAPPVLARGHGEAEVLELVLPLRVHPPEHVGDPANPRLAENHLETRIALEGPREDHRGQDVGHV